MSRVAFMRLHWFFKVLLVLLILASIWSTIAYGLPKFLPQKIISNSDVSGLIFRNQIWDGTVRIKGDLVTVPGVTITIKPGTQVLVAVKGDNFNLDFLPWHIKSGVNTKGWYHGVNKGEPFWDEKEKVQIHIGRLNAVGTKEQPIIIKSDSVYPSPYDFNTLDVSHGVLSFARVSDYRRFEISNSVVLRNNLFRNVGECGVCIISGHPSVLENVFEDALRESIWIKRASPRIIDNLFTNLSGTGIKIESEGLAIPVISQNTFEMPSKTVIDILSGGEKEGGLVSFNKFSGNSVVNIACDSKIKLTENILLSLISFSGSGCGGSYTFGPNYWGASDVKTVLSERITNKDKKFEVLIPSILTSPPPLAGRRVKN